MKAVKVKTKQKTNRNRKESLPSPGGMSSRIAGAILCLTCLGAWNLPAQDFSASSEETFFLKSDSLTIPELCALLSDHYKVSILPHGSLARETVTATFEAGNLTEALEVLAFLTGKEVRESGRFYLLGGEGEEKLVSLPATGLDASAAQLFGERNAVLVGRSVLFRGNSEAAADASEAIEAIQEREDAIETAAFRLVVVDVSNNDREPFGEWLNGFEAVAGIDGNTASDLITGELLTQAGTITGAFSVSALVEMVERLRSSEVITDTVVSLVDGQPLKITAGQILEREISESVPTDGGGSRFRSGFDRLNIGFELELEPVRLLTGWRIGANVGDSSLVNGSETRTEFEGVSIIRDGRQLPVLLADLARAGHTVTEDRPNIWPLKLLRRKVNGSEDRRLVLFLEPCDVSKFGKPDAIRPELKEADSSRSRPLSVIGRLQNR